MGQSTQQSNISLWDFGRINYQIIKIITENNILDKLISLDAIEEGRFSQPGKSIIIKTKEPIGLMGVKVTVNNLMSSVIMEKKDIVMQILMSLGYGDDSESMFYSILFRLDMLYTALQLTDNEYCIILI